MKYSFLSMASLSIDIFGKESLENKICLLYKEIEEKFDEEIKKIILINGESQKLYFIEYMRYLKKIYSISTSRYGFGNKPGSMKTPKGIHRIIKKYGDNAPTKTIFESKNNTGIIYQEGDKGIFMTSRLIQIEGCEKQNQFTRSRGIYIHGISDESEIGTPASHGCIRMKNKDIIELYDLVDIGTYVYIKERL